MKKAISISSKAGFALLVAFMLLAWTPVAGHAYLKGDIDGDNRISLTETIHSLQVLTGLRDAEPVRTINVPGDIPSIQQAIDSAAEGDTIRIAAGTFTENIVIRKNRIILEGAGRNTVIEGNGAETIMLNGAMDVVISGMTLQGGTFGIRSVMSSFLGENLLVENAAVDGMRVSLNSLAVLEDCEVQNSGNDGIMFSLNSTGVLWGALDSSNNGRDGLSVQHSSAVILDSFTRGAENETMNATLENNDRFGLIVSNSSSLISFGSRLTSTGSGRDGVSIMDGSSIQLQHDADWTILNASRRGFQIFNGSNCHMSPQSRLTIEGSVDRGLSLLTNASLFSEGEVNITGTSGGEGRGILLYQNASLFFYGATALVENNAGDGVLVYDNSSLSIIEAGTVNIQNNGETGISVHASSHARIIGQDKSIRQNGGYGIFAGLGSLLQINGAIIEANAADLDVLLWFGSQGAFQNSTFSPDRFACHDTADADGDRICQ